MMLPIVTHEKLVNLFYFYLDGEIRKGMRCRNGLYRLVKSFDVAERAVAHALGCKLAAKGAQTVITVSDTNYEVWVDFRYTHDHQVATTVRDETSISSAVPV